MPAPHFFKLTNDAVYGSIKYVDGININAGYPELSGTNSFNFWTLKQLEKYATTTTHIWDVEIPEDETRIVMGGHVCKAASLIMRNIRPCAEILRTFTPKQQLAIWRNYPALMKKFEVKVTAEMYEAAAPKLLYSRGPTDVYDNGLHVTKTGDVYHGTFTQDTVYVDAPIRAGNSFRCCEFRMGHAYGVGDWWTPTNMYCTGLFMHTIPEGCGTRAELPGVWKMGVFTADPVLVARPVRKVDTVEVMPVVCSTTKLTLAALSDAALNVDNKTKASIVTDIGGIANTMPFPTRDTYKGTETHSINVARDWTVVDALIIKNN